MDKEKVVSDFMSWYAQVKADEADELVNRLQGEFQSDFLERLRARNFRQIYMELLNNMSIGEIELIFNQLKEVYRTRGRFAHMFEGQRQGPQQQGGRKRGQRKTRGLKRKTRGRRQ